MVPAPASRRHGVVVLAMLDRSGVRPVKGLLRDLSTDYPGGDIWLDRRLEDALIGDAECWITMCENQVTGVTILTPKSSALKLSTIYVAKWFRGHGLGGLLMDRTLQIAAAMGRDETYVTVAQHKLSLLRPLLDSRGFACTAIEKHRYGHGRHEFIFTRLKG